MLVRTNPAITLVFGVSNETDLIVRGGDIMRDLIITIAGIGLFVAAMLIGGLDIYRLLLIGGLGGISGLLCKVSK